MYLYNMMMIQFNDDILQYDDKKNATMATNIIAINSINKLTSKKIAHR